MKYTFEDLKDIMKKLRGEGGCPWDAEQTHQSIKDCLIEEAYETAEAIDSGIDAKMYDELGDVLLQVVFHAEIASEEGRFDIDDITNAICTKLIRRHPHVFADGDAKTSAEVLDKWDEIKKIEKGEESTADTLMSVSPYLPALTYAKKVQKKASKVGFDWDSWAEPLEKVSEETEELKCALKDGTNIEEELGDLLFSAVNVSRFAGVDPEEALRKTTAKFINRFKAVETMAKQAGKNLEDMSLQEMDKLWDIAKLQQK